MIVRRGKRDPKKWLLGGLLLLALAVVAGIYFVSSQFGGKAEGSASTVSLDESQGLQAAFDFTPVTVRGSYASFSHPKSFGPDAPNPTDSIDLASYRYKYHADNTWQLAAAIERLPSPSLKNDSGYIYRTLHPEKYRPSTKTVAGKTYIIMTDTSQPGFNQVAYTEFHGNLVGVIALTGYESAGDNDLERAFDMVLASWQWL